MARRGTDVPHGGRIVTQPTFANVSPVRLAIMATGIVSSDGILAARIVQRLLSMDGMRCTMDADPDAAYDATAWACDLVRAVVSEIRP